MFVKNHKTNGKRIDHGESAHYEQRSGLKRLTLSMLGKNFSRRHVRFFSIFFFSEIKIWQYHEKCLLRNLVKSFCKETTPVFCLIVHGDRLWSDATSCGVWAESTLISKPGMSVRILTVFIVCFKSTIAVLNKLGYHAYFQYLAGYVTWSRLLKLIHILNFKQCRSRSVGFYTVCKSRAYPIQQDQGWIWPFSLLKLKTE